MRQLDVRHEAVLGTLQLALSLTADIQAAYCAADPTKRRLFNQAFFERLEVDGEEITGRTLAAPFAQIIAHDLIADAVRSTPRARGKGQAAGRPREPQETRTGHGGTRVPGVGRNARTPALPSRVGGSCVARMVGRLGFEPRTLGLKVPCSDQLS